MKLVKLQHAQLNNCTLNCNSVYYSMLIHADTSVSNSDADTSVNSVATVKLVIVTPLQ